MIERDRIVAELDADLGKDAIGSRLDLEEVFFRQDVVGRDVAQDEGPAETVRTMAALLAAGDPATTPHPLGSGGVHGDVGSVHGWLPCHRL